MLTGIKAFEARWQALKDAYPTSPEDSRLLMQAMGRLVDNYATQAEIMIDLPRSLQLLFAQLVEAYLNGCWVENTSASSQPVVSPAILAARQLRQQHQPTEASEAATYITGNLQIGNPSSSYTPIQLAKTIS